MKPKHTRFLAVFDQILQLDRRIVIIFLVALIFLIAGTASTNHTPRTSPNHSQVATATPLVKESKSAFAPTPSPFPQELLENGNQTIGLTIAASIIVLIVLVGVLNALLRASPGDR